ncbi:MAG: amidohydrolase [Pseudomonadales bacterium]|nr:amidohydrolase [Pseudomonadales bacterium]
MQNYSYIDFDAHYYEPDDCFSRHIEAKFKASAIRPDRTKPDGLGRMMIADQRLHFTSVIQNDFVGAPGLLKAFFKGENSDSGAVNLNPICPRDHAYMMQKAARLAVMDAQNVEASVMLPTLGVTVQHHLSRFSELEYPSYRAFNRWVEEDWGYGADQRIYASACLSLNQLAPAIEELERLIAAGVRLLHLPCGAINGKSPGDPYFDPFWARAAEAGVVICFHIGETNYNESYAAQWGEPANPPIHRFSALNTFWGIGARTITDHIAAMLCHNVFGRHPSLQIAIIEFGASWVFETLSNLDKIYRMADHKDKWRFGKPSEKPSTQFKQHCAVVPFFEENIPALVNYLGDECLINGSDFPHPEGLEAPAEMLAEMETLNQQQQRAIMRGNAARILRISD